MHNQRSLLPNIPLDGGMRLVFSKPIIVSPEARRYALKELIRRSGVARDTFLQWTINVLPERTTLSLGSDTQKQIHFLHSPHGILRTNISSFRMAKAAWLKPPENEATCADLIIPY